MLDTHIANVGSEHFPAGYFSIPYTLTPPDAESFPQPPPPPPTPGGRPLWQVGPAGQSLLGLDRGLYNKKNSVWESSWTKQRGYIENKGVFAQAEQGSYMVSITWHTRNTWEYTGKKGGFGRKGYVACTGGYECIMHNACTGALGSTSSLPIVMMMCLKIPHFGLFGYTAVYSRLQYLSIRPYTLEYTAVYLEYTAVYWGYLFAPGGCFKLKNSIVVPFVPILLHSLPLPNNCTPLETNLGSYSTHDWHVGLHMCPFQSILCCFLLSQALFFCHHG